MISRDRLTLQAGGGGAGGGLFLGGLRLLPRQSFLHSLNDPVRPAAADGLAGTLGFLVERGFAVALERARSRRRCSWAGRRGR